MGIFNRLNQVVRANLNSLIDSAEDPEKLIAQTVSDMQKGLKQAKQELVQALGTAKRLDAEVKKHETKGAEWEKRAVLALDTGDEDLAREALKQKLQSGKHAGLVRARAVDAQAAADRMKDALERLEQKAQDLDAQKGILAAQVTAARKTRSAPSEEGSAFGDLERMTQRIDLMEAEIEASAVLEDPSQARLEARFEQLEKSHAGQEVEDELAQLKRKAGN